MSLENLKLHWKPNQFLVAPAGYTASEPHLESPVYPVSADQLKTALLSLLADQPRVSVKSQEGWLIEASQTTPLLRFKDLISIEILPGEGEESRLAIYSRSILGIRDFGVNKQRITAWLDLLQADIPPKA